MQTRTPNQQRADALAYWANQAYHLVSRASYSAADASAAMANKPDAQKHGLTAADIQARLTRNMQRFAR